MKEPDLTGLNENVRFRIVAKFIKKFILGFREI
jgi:hypothetical protein